MASLQQASEGNAVLEQLIDSGLGPLLEDREVCAFLKEGFKEAGCRPPFHIIVFALVKKGTLLGWEFGGQALKSRLLEMLVKNERLRSWLDGVANVCRRQQDQNRLREDMLQYLRGRLPAGSVPDFDEATHEEVLTQLYTNERFNRQDEQLDAIVDILQDVLSEKSRNTIAPHLGWATGSCLTIADSIRYNSGLFEFTGRESELDLLGRFCGDVSLATPGNRFSWLLLTGAGGEGKTRLALEFTSRHIGENWTAGRLSLQDLPRFGYGEWLPAKPTLIVIDYPAQDPESVHALLANLARRHLQFDWPVRVLLLEREAKGPWYDTVFPSNGDGAAIRNYAFVHGGQAQMQGLPIEPIGEDAIAALMEARFARAKQVSPERELLLDAVARIDNRVIETAAGKQRRPRPLFAAALAEVMIAALKRGETVDTKWINLLVRDDVLAEIIKRDRITHWTTFASDPDVLRHENLLALATLAGGLQRSDLRKLPAEIKSLFPDPGEASGETLNENLISRMSNYEKGRIAPLEPDLLGEHFLLSRLERIKEIYGRDACELFCAAAYELGNREATESALRTASDFTEQVEEIGWLLPGDGCSAKSLLGAWILAVGLTGQLGHRACSAIDALAKFEDRGETDNLIARAEAMAAVNVTYNAVSEFDWDRIKSTIKRLDVLRRAFPEDAELAFRDAQATVNIIDAFNLSIFPGKVSDRAKIEALLTATNGKAADWPLVDRMVEHLDAIRLDFATNRELAEMEADAALVVTGYALKDGNWTRTMSSLRRFDTLRRAFPNSVKIALLQARALVRISRTAAVMSDLELVTATVAEQHVIQCAFQDVPEIGLEAAKGVLNLAYVLGAKGDWSGVQEVLENRAWSLRGLMDDEVARSFHKMTIDCYLSLRKTGYTPDQDSTIAAVESAQAWLQLLWSDPASSPLFPALQLISDAHSRFPNNIKIGDAYREVRELDFDFDELPEIE